MSQRSLSVPPPTFRSRLSHTLESLEGFFKVKGSQLVPFGVCIVISLVFTEAISERTGSLVLEIGTLMAILRSVERDSFEEVTYFTKLAAVYGFLLVLGSHIMKILFLALSSYSTIAQDIYDVLLAGRFFNRSGRRSSAEERDIVPVKTSSLPRFRHDAFRLSNE
ncbi:hypothetical protein BIW11_08454 [Tropilaelaps mercedesae]|uniref:Uncharacterized protein n=1 Tax=Tropilaelaps mercedesae TaxID=418985 RepID=A0A1V9XPE5_9ACAR|nr:hypothetical protein BIW11_08454 [Tropilaelaps mercedesae]